MVDRSLTLRFLGKDDGASRTTLEIAAAEKTLQDVLDKNNRIMADQDKQLKNLEKSFKDADRGMNGLLLTALELGPALIPIGAVGVGAIAGLVPAAAAAGLAFLGLRDAWHQGNLQATQLGKQIAIFQGEFDKLKQIAAGGVMPGLTKGLQELQPLFPVVNRNIALFATQLGSIAAKVMPGLVQMFIQLQPLFQTFGDLLVQGATKFQQWAASGSGIKNFVAYVQTQLPAVLSTISSLVVTVSNLVQAFAPFGSTSLLAIKLFSEAINAIPIGVLQTLVPLIAGLALGLKALKEAQAAATGLELLAGKIGAAGFGAKAASGLVGGLGTAVKILGPIGLAAGIGLGALSLVMGNHAKAAQEAAKRTNELTQSFQDGNTRFVLYTQLVKNGAIPAADALGISQKTVYDAATRTGSGMADLQAQIFIATGKYNALSAATQQSATINSAQATSLETLRNHLVNLSVGVQQAQKNYDDAKKATAEWAKAQGDAALSAEILGGHTKEAAAALGLTEDAYINGKLAADKHTASSQAATAAMTIEGDAAGLLTQELNLLTDAQLGASDANLGFKLANLQLQAQLKATKGDLSLNTQAGLQNNQAVNQAIRLAEQDGEALAKQEQSSKGMARAKADGTAKTIADLVALRASIASYGGNTSAVDALIKKLQGYNQTPVPPKKVDVNTAAGGKAVDDLGNKIRNLPDRTVSVKLIYDTSQVGSAGIASGGRAVSGATGGHITGPGTRTSDSILMRASNGEFMMQAAAVSKYGVGFMDSLNKMKFAAGGPINLVMPPNPTITGRLNTLISMLHPTQHRAAPSGIPGGGGPSSAGVSALQSYAFSLFRYYGWDESQLGSLIALWNGESGWNANAVNPSSGAWGIPQSLPGDKMASAGADWRTNGATQIRWGENYISQVYGSPSAAYGAWLSRSPHWYGGGMDPTVFTRPTLIGVGDSGPETVSVTRGRGRGATVVVNINVSGSVTTERNLATTVRTAIRDQLRSEGKLATVI